MSVLILLWLGHLRLTRHALNDLKTESGYLLLSVFVRLGLNCAHLLSSKRSLLFSLLGFQQNLLISSLPTLRMVGPRMTSALSGYNRSSYLKLPQNHRHHAYYLLMGMEVTVPSSL